MKHRPSPYATAAARWAAVQRKDPEADGHFVFAVRTTGIYCRPSCPSRRALRKNVLFLDNAQEAERAGFRPCKRCQPHSATPSRGQHAEKIAAACRAMDAAEDMPGLDALARAAGMSRHHFHRVFTQATGLTPKAYGQAIRAARARHHLLRAPSVTSAIYEAGYSSSSRFYSQSNQLLGMKPKKFLQGAPGEEILHATARCPLGFLLVAASERGVCAIFLGDDPNSLVSELRDRFPKARLIPGGKSFQGTVKAAVALAGDPGAGFNLPLDIRGTAFQRRVWQALREIPPGATATYSDIAEQIGSPRAVRAVAGACAANAIAMAIPCHRVLHKNGRLSGYRWGRERKHELLQKEKNRTLHPPAPSGEKQSLAIRHTQERLQ